MDDYISHLHVPLLLCTFLLAILIICRAVQHKHAIVAGPVGAASEASSSDSPSPAVAGPVAAAGISEATAIATTADDDAAFFPIITGSSRLLALFRATRPQALPP